MTQREAEIVEKTGWTLAELDAIPAGRLERLMHYWNAKGEHEHEREQNRPRH